MGRGGARHGAGRPGWKGKAEQCPRLDVRELHRAGLLVPGRSGSWSWSCNGQSWGWVGLRAELDVLYVQCTVNGAPNDHRVLIETTSCNYGGSRPWFACPLCSRRVAVLYLRDRGPFRCRHCAQVAYFSQSEDATGRAWRKQRKIEAKLTVSGEKPKGMHWRTFNRLRAGIGTCDERRDAALVALCGRLFPHLLKR